MVLDDEAGHVAEDELAGRQCRLKRQKRKVRGCEGRGVNERASAEAPQRLAMRAEGAGSGRELKAPAQETGGEAVEGRALTKYCSRTPSPSSAVADVGSIWPSSSLAGPTW